MSEKSLLEPLTAASTAVPAILAHAPNRAAAPAAEPPPRHPPLEPPAAHEALSPRQLRHWGINE